MLLLRLNVLRASAASASAATRLLHTTQLLDAGAGRDGGAYGGDGRRRDRSRERHDSDFRRGRGRGNDDRRERQRSPRRSGGNRPSGRGFGSAGKRRNEDQPREARSPRRELRGEWEDEEPSRGRSGRDRETLAGAATAAARNLDEEWQELRAKTFPIPRARDPFEGPIKKALQDRQRRRRLGLLPEQDDDDDAFVDRYRQQLEKQRAWAELQERRRAKASSNDGGETPRRYTRNPMGPKEKTFTRLRAAPDSVTEREYLEPDEPEDPRALDIAVIGRPNAGKSSIVNRLLNATISAVSPKYNTTRDRVMGILTVKDTQLSFYDTPGLIKPKESHQYIRELVTTAAETVESVDMSMLVVDSVKRLDDDAMEALSKFVTTSAQMASPLMLVMNKCDLVGTREEFNLKHKVRDISQMITDIYKTHYDEDEAMMEGDPLKYIGDNALRVSALKGTGMGHLKSTLLSLAVERPWSFHSSVKSDQSDLELVTEIIREKLFRRFHKDLPYSFHQENVGWTRFKDHSIRIDQDIFVPAARVRKMVVGTDGNTIRSVGIAAREEIEALLGCPVHLYLNVRVQ